MTAAPPPVDRLAAEAEALARWSERYTAAAERDRRRRWGGVVRPDDDHHGEGAAAAQHRHDRA